MSRTIVACATGRAGAALAVLRLSGAQAKTIARAVTGCPFETPRRMELVQLRHDELTIDRCLAVYFAAPASFTGEDVVEFHTHGGPGLVTAALEALEAAGASPAEPGEFTRRAYLAGKLDLVEAEAIAARVDAASARAARLAEAGVAGRLSAFARRVETALTEQRAEAEAWLDFEPEELLDDDRLRLENAIKDLADELSEAAAVGRRALPLFERPAVLLAGPVNAGKSSLFNALAGMPRAIVSAEAGTTRDWLEVELQLPGGRIRLQDSAGQRRAEGSVEAAGIASAQRLQAEADLVLWCCPPEDLAPAPPGAWTISTKADIARGPGLALSSHSGEGIAELLTAIDQHLFADPGEDSACGVPTSRRQLELLESAAQASARAVEQLPVGALELAASDLREAAESLAALTGTQEPDEAMLDALFGRFCLGK